MIGDGFTPGKKVEFFWSTVEAIYATKVMTDNVEYHERKYDEKRVAFGSALVDAQGRVSAKFTAPEDFGEVHDLYAVIDGQDAARGGFRILRSAASTPTEGPVGTPITVTVKGMGWQGFEQFMALRYDNKYTGEISAVTTKGTAVFQIRAAARPASISFNSTTAPPTRPAPISTPSNRRRLISTLISTTNKSFVLSSTLPRTAGPPPDSSAVAGQRPRCASSRAMRRAPR